jgi:RNA polymerase sigma factor (sigma-70 family)
MQEYTSRKEAEKALATSLQKSEPEVLALLYDAYAPVLLGLISRIVRNSQRAEYVLQETFVAIWRQRATYNAAHSGLLTWMIMVAKETALAVLPTNGFINQENKQALPENAWGIKIKLPEEVVEPNSFRELKADEQALLDLIYLNGCSRAEAAATLGISEENLKITLRQAINHLRANK